MADFEAGGDKDVLKKVRKDFDAKGVAQSDRTDCAAMMDELMAKAVAADQGELADHAERPTRVSVSSTCATSARDLARPHLHRPDSRARSATPRLFGALSAAAASLLGPARCRSPAQRKRHEVGDVRADRRLPLEAVAGKTPVPGERVPQARARHRSDCGAAAAPARAPARARPAPGPAVLGEQRAQQRRLVAVEHAARAPAPCGLRRSP